MKATASVVVLLAIIALSTCENPSSSCSCGLTKYIKKTQERIVGGTNAIVNEFPLIGALSLVTRPHIVYCASTIITKRHAISAAHCNKGPWRPVTIHVGEHDTQLTNESISYRVPVEKFISHEDYDLEGNTEHDIAVVFLARDLEFGPTVGPACFPDIETSSNLIGKKVRIAGWGRLFFKGTQPNVLHKVDVEVVPMGACAKKYTGTTDGQICTYTVQKDACQGDSGGPVLYMNPSTRRYSIVGIVSYGPSNCALKDHPGVHTNVTAYSDWIHEKIEETDPTSAVCPNQ